MKHDNFTKFVPIFTEKMISLLHMVLEQITSL